ncbi:hypothetical protein L1887_17019 [Cichorium endivia]|nr:hypothetical protein L1887_17019 [Cichorium endivia]
MWLKSRTLAKLAAYKRGGKAFFQSLSLFHLFCFILKLSFYYITYLPSRICIYRLPPFAPPRVSSVHFFLQQ